MKKGEVNRNNSNNNHNGYETAGRIMTSKILIVKEDFSLLNVERLLKEGIDEFEMIDYIYVVEKKKLIGVFSIKEIFRNAKSTFVKKVMKKEIISVRSHTDQERATFIALKNDLKAVPVVDKDGNFLGVIPPQIILETIHNEGLEDVLRSAGIGKFKDPAYEIIQSSTMVHAKKRFPWLLIGLIGGVIAAMIVSYFEDILDAYILLAAFIPAVVYMADAVGAQSQTIFIRSLAIDKKLQIGKYSLRELKVNMILGSLLGFIFYLVVLIGWGLESSFFALILGISIFSTVIISMAISLILPLIFEKINFDPAISSGPLGTAIRDLTSLLVYFGIARFLIMQFL